MDLNRFEWMIHNNYVPYQNIWDAPGQNMDDLKNLSVYYFSDCVSSILSDINTNAIDRHQLAFALGISVYDWTTADFARITIMNIFRYSQTRMCHNYNTYTYIYCTIRYAKQK